MVVAVIAVRMMQMTVNKIVDVVTMRYRLVTTTWAVNMIRIMTTALVRWCAAIGIGLTRFDTVFHNGPIFANMMQMPVMQIVDVVAVLNAGVLTVRSVLVIVIFVLSIHRCSPGERVVN